MPDSLRNRRLNPTFSHLKIDGAKAENDDKDSGNSSVSRARSHYQIINFQNWDQRWQHLQEERERLRVQQERFSALLPPDFFLSDDDQSSSSSDPSLHSDQSKGQIINFKKLEKCDPALYQRWQHLQEERERLRVQQECFLARLSPDFFLSDDAQSSRPSDPSLHSDRSKGQIINFKKLEKCDPDRYQMWQHLQKQRERLRCEKNVFGPSPT
nr:uncharacterized protein LOC109975379 [Labrus bergylta]